jgi:hypothetical protein
MEIVSGRKIFSFGKQKGRRHGVYEAFLGFFSRREE